MSTKTIVCIEVECDDCGMDGWDGLDYGHPHFRPGDDLATTLAGYEWTVTETGEHYCIGCTAKRACEAAGGHTWGDWLAGTDSQRAIRWCQRQECDSTEYRPVTEVALPGPPS